MDTRIHAIGLTPEELVGALAAVDTVLDRCGNQLAQDDPAKHTILVTVRAKLYLLLGLEQQAIVTA